MDNEKKLFLTILNSNSTQNMINFFCFKGESL